MPLFSSLLINAVVAAAPATPLPWYRFEDYPMKAFAQEWKGAATFELLVDPKGRPSDCTILHSSGYAALDRETCFIALNRARFTPARGPDGATVHGSYRSVVKWHRPDQDELQAEPGPDLEVTLDSLPAGTPKPSAVKIAYFVDAQGRASNCTLLPDSRVRSQALVSAACQEVMARLAGPANASANGRSTVRTAAVLFTTRD